MRFVHALLLSALAGFLASAPARAESGLFGTAEMHSTNLAPFTKWDGVVERSAREAADPDAFCGKVTPEAHCIAGWWADFVQELKSLPLAARARRANEVLNRVRYVTAEANWHDPDHWETPFEFLTRGGQCQDYAIAKYMALEASGVPDESLRLAVVRDTWNAADHAVTIVYLDGAPMVLDNQTSDVVPAERLDRYVPYYSINRGGWWYHVRARTAPVQVARTGDDTLAR